MLVGSYLMCVKNHFLSFQINFAILFGKAFSINRRTLIILGMAVACKFNLIQFWVTVKLVSIYFNVVRFLHKTFIWSSSITLYTLKHSTLACFYKRDHQHPKYNQEMKETTSQYRTLIYLCNEIYIYVLNFYIHLSSFML